MARWKAPGTPGRFQVRANGVPLSEIFGVTGVDWYWQDGGKIEIDDKKKITLTLHDLTGFEGRCDAIVLTNERDFELPNTQPGICPLPNGQDS